MEIQNISMKRLAGSMQVDPEIAKPSQDLLEI
jgi:hypothetical protein